VRSITDDVTVERVCLGVSAFSPASHHSAIALYISEFCDSPERQQYLITASLFKRGASFVAWYLADYRVRKLVLQICQLSVFYRVYVYFQHMLKKCHAALFCTLGPQVVTLFFVIQINVTHEIYVISEVKFTL
jgi:hypothetical protein